MYFRQLLTDETSCASYLFGCKTKGTFAVVDPHIDLVDEYVALADSQGIPIVAVLDTHVQADHVSGLPELVARTGARAYLPAGAGIDFEHHPLADGDLVRLGNTEVQAIATPGHALAHHAYLVTDHRRSDVRADQHATSIYMVADPARERSRRHRCHDAGEDRP